MVLCYNNYRYIGRVDLKAEVGKSVFMQKAMSASFMINCFLSNMFSCSYCYDVRESAVINIANV